MVIHKKLGIKIPSFFEEFHSNDVFFCKIKSK